jgi:hypothetical protein
MKITDVVIIIIVTLLVIRLVRAEHGQRIYKQIAEDAVTELKDALERIENQAGVIKMLQDKMRINK